MKDLISFAKYSGCGNDFIIIDNRKRLLTLKKEEVIKLCHRNYGIGADGVILLENGFESPYRMRIYNCDGSEAEMCGNGLRCLASFIFSKTPFNRSIAIETMHGKMQASLHENEVIVFLEHKTQDITHHEILINGVTYKGHYIDTGVPHLTIFVNDLEDPELFKIAPDFRNHPLFLPRGTNVNFAKITSKNSINIRTYERGVEKETLACGTGATASAITAASIYHLNLPITVQTRSQDLIEISFDGALPHISSLSMKGPADKVFEGKIHQDFMGQYGK